MWDWLRKKKPAKKPVKVQVAHLAAPVDDGYTVGEVHTEELGNTDLEALVKCIEQREQVKNGTFIDDTTLFEQTRWGKSRR